jgi:hypothetical protein
MSDQSADKVIMDAFEHWWHLEGSAMGPLSEDDQETHVKRISAIAWSNGAYVNGLYDNHSKLDSSIEP